MTTTPFEREQAAERRVRLWAFLVNAAVGVGIWIISASSILTRWEIEGVDKSWIEPWVLEGTSPLVTIPLFFAVYALERRAPLGTTSWKIALPVHVAGAITFCTLVIAWMALFRGTVWPILFDESYNLFDDGAVQVYIYEFRKLLPGYLGPLVLIYFVRQLEMTKLERDAALEEARTTHRLTLKCGGRTIFVDADEFQTAKAAGNYIEIKLTTGKQLARLTLAELERQLKDAGVDAVRVHRSWLVNRASIKEVAPTGEGDVSITLSDGDTVPGSRRYREQLAA
jgi:hypothetical protein